MGALEGPSRTARARKMVWGKAALSALTMAALVTGMAGTATAAEKKAPAPKAAPKADKKSASTTSSPAPAGSSSSAPAGSSSSTNSASVSAASTSPSATPASGPAAKSSAKAGPGATPGSTCGEDSFLGTQFPAAGTAVNVGEEIGAIYHDETPLNQDTVIFKVDNAPVTPALGAGTVPKGDKFATKISYVIPSNLASGEHTAFLFAEDTDQNKTGGDCGQATWTFTVAPHNPVVDLSVTKVADPTAVLVGAPVTYTIAVKNNGADADTGVKAVDTLPAGVTFVSATTSAGTCSENAGTLSCDLGDLASGASDTITVKVNAPATTGTFVNKVDVSGDKPETDMTNNHAEAAIVVTKNAPKVDLAVTKTADPSSVQVQGTVVYTVTVKNNGPDSDPAAKLVDTLPSGTSFVSATSSVGSCSFATGLLTCNLGVMNNGDSAKVMVTLTAPNTVGQFINKADVSGGAPDSDLSNNHAEAPATTFQTPPPNSPKVDLGITKTADKDSVATRGDLKYTLRAVNNGPDTATNVVITDNLPAGIEVGAITPSTGTCSRSNLLITCSVGTMAPGAVVTVTVATKAPTTGGTITNYTHVGGSEPDSDLSNNNASVTTPVTEVQGLVVNAPVVPAAPAAAAVKAAGPLAFTGANSGLLAMLGSGLAIMAFGFLLAGRRRRTAQD